MLYHLAVVGAGSSAAYYLSTIDREMYPNILIISEDDPWSGKRGVNPTKAQDPVNFVNHTPQMIGHYGDTMHAQGKSLYKRLDFAAANKDVIDAVKTTQIKDRVRNIAEVTLPEGFQYGKDRKKKGFRIEVASSIQRYYAKKIVIASGAGDHSVPAGVKNDGEVVLNMDEFNRKSWQIRDRSGKTVVLLGPNAAVDVADIAGFQGFQVKWLMGKDGRGTQKPAFLPTGHQVYAEKNENKNVMKIVFQREKPLQVDRVGKKVRVSYTDEDGKTQIINADYFVYGIGQNLNKDEKEKFLNFVDSGIRGKMEPVYDINQRFGDAHQTVLGFQMTGTGCTEGFEVIGSACSQIIKCQEIKHRYVEMLAERIKEVQDSILKANSSLNPSDLSFLGKRPEDYILMSAEEFQYKLESALMHTKLEAKTWLNIMTAFSNLLSNYRSAVDYFSKKANVVDDDLSKVAKSLTPSVMQSQQLGAIRSTTAAQNGYAPGYINKGQINFSADDRQMIRVFIAVHFPFVSESDAQMVINKVLAGRKDHPWGYEDEESKKFYSELAMLNSKGASPLTVPKTNGSGQTLLVH